LSSGNGTNAIWTFVAPMLAIVLVSPYRLEIVILFILVGIIPQKKTQPSCRLDQQCVSGTGPSQCVQKPWTSYVRNETEGKTYRSCCVSDDVFSQSISLMQLFVMLTSSVDYI